MINVKLVVLFIFIGNICECYYDYCKICSSHTLCLYKNPGPGPSCKSYDKTAAITRDDVETIVNKINQRRNFVALGLARNLPSAANMNQMRWSEELAVIAQRWADQCDPAIRPDKKDLCRDLEDTKVGQNIATVTGLSPGLNVKSLVEVWYMQALMYTGSVTYYNQSKESKTNDFTQLIWADTTLVGCGKVRFSIDDKGTMVDRFVCNFAPKGNIFGKPVYTIGYPATQCKDDSGKDEIFTGLCKSVPEKPQTTITTQSESSLLRILNLPNNPAKQDPISGNYKNREKNMDVINFIRHQNLRHIPSKTYGLIHHLKPQIIPALQNIPLRQDFILRQHTTGQSQYNHGSMRTTSHPEQQGDKNYVRETIDPYYDEPDVSLWTFSIFCTRTPRTTHQKDVCNIANTEQNECSKRKKENEYKFVSQPDCKTTERKEQTIHSCSSQKLTCLSNPTTTSYNCDINCHCVKVNNPTTKNHHKIPGEYVYYDYVPDLALREGENIEASSQNEHSSNSLYTSPQSHINEHYEDEYFYGIKNFQLRDKDTRGRSGYRKQFQSPNNPYRIYPRKRSKRQTPFSTSFWIADEFNKREQKRNPKYTTLRNKARKKFRTTTKPLWYDTEPITLTTKDLRKHRYNSTDKLLSFEELMYFRKNRGGEVDLGKRKQFLRTNNTNNTTPTTTTTTKTSSTSKITIIGSFSPVSACTRRITCTWTKAKMTDINGNEIDDGKGGGNAGGGGGGFDDGRTPWGHVENCTRKYTCSRLHYDRNVQASDTTEAGETTIADEDYCEKRALDVKRKDFHETRAIRQKENHETFTEDTSAHGNIDCLNNTEDTRKKRSLSCQQGKQTQKPITQKKTL